jgi:hypothetical protein
MTEPPIPPGCEAWELFFLILYSDASRKVVRADADLAVERVDQLRAALYRTKWLDEANRITREMPWARSLWDRANENAAAWRKWGER